LYFSFCRIVFSYRLPQDLPSSAKEERVSEIMRVLGLHHICESVVGSEEKRGISGGQKKRLSIGVEIIHMPEMIFLDEPTTGLDSAIAYEVMYAVRQIANQNRTILCTIHQPSKITFELFDKVMLLGEGQMFYYGKRDAIINYFVNSVYSFPFKYGSNPADYIIAISCQALSPSAASSSASPLHAGEEDKKGTTPSVLPAQLIEMYQKTTLYQEFLNSIDNILSTDLVSYNNYRQQHNLPLLDDEAKNSNNNQVYHTSLTYQIRTLVRRLFVRKRRELLHTSVVTFR
jgi:ABC-type multidrug transport system ATPase subunit